MLKHLQLTGFLTIGFIVFCISAIMLNLHTWNFTAHQLGYDTYVNYQSRGAYCNSIPTENQKEWQRIYEDYETQIKNREPFPEKQAFDIVDRKLKFEDALIGLCSDGIFILLSITGLIILWTKRKKIREERMQGRLSLSSWLFILIALYCHWFIMEFVFEVIGAMMGISPDFGSWISWMSDYLHLNGWFFLSFNCLIGLLVLSYITFRIVPRRQLIPFLVSGLAGGILSRMIWYSWLGPILMPFA